MDVVECMADALAEAGWLPEIDPSDDRGWLQIAWDALRGRRHSERRVTVEPTALPPGCQSS